MSATRSALKFFGVQAPPVKESVNTVDKTSRQAVMAKASRSLKDINDLLGCVTKELAEGDLELADLIVSAR